MQRRTVQTQSTQSGREHRLEKAAGQGSRSPLRASGSTNQRQAIRAELADGGIPVAVTCRVLKIARQPSISATTAFVTVEARSRDTSVS